MPPTHLKSSLRKCSGKPFYYIGDLEMLSLELPVGIKYKGVLRVEGLGNDVILLSSLIWKIVPKAAREFYLSVVVNITSDLGQCIKQLTPCQAYKIQNRCSSVFHLPETCRVVDLEGRQRTSWGRQWWPRWRRYRGLVCSGKLSDRQPQSRSDASGTAYTCKSSREHSSNFHLWRRRQTPGYQGATSPSGS